MGDAIAKVDVLYRVFIIKYPNYGEKVFPNKDATAG